MRLDELFITESGRALERIKQTERELSDRLSPGEKSRIASIKQKISDLSSTDKDQAERHGEMVHDFVNKLNSKYSSNDNKREDNRNAINDKQAKKEMQVNEGVNYAKLVSQYRAAMKAKQGDEAASLRRQIISGQGREWFEAKVGGQNAIQKDRPDAHFSKPEFSR